MKKIIYYIVSIVITGVAANFAVTSLYKNDNTFVAAFTEAKADEIFAVVEITGVIDAQYISKENREILIANIAKNIGLDEDILINRDIKGNVDTLNITRKVDKAVLEIKLIENNTDKGYAYYLSARMEIQDNLSSVMPYKNSIYQAIDMYCSSDKATVNILGNYNGNLNEKTRKKISKSIMNRLNGKEVKHIQTEGVDSLYGYTNMISDSILDNNKKINFNIAFYYDEQSNKTYLYLATPTITLAY